jgi:hypothetical protein
LSFPLSCVCNESAPVPAPWSRVDIGTIGGDGFGFANNCVGTICVESYGFNVPAADKTHFAYTEMCGDGTFTVRVVSVTPGSGRGGIMFRDNFTPGSPKAALKTNFTYNTLLWRDIRVEQDAYQVTKDHADGGPRVAAVGAGRRLLQRVCLPETMRCTNSYSTKYVPMDQCIDIGLYVESPNVNTYAQACFADISITDDAYGSPYRQSCRSGTASYLEGIRWQRPTLPFIPTPSRDELTVELEGWQGQEGTLIADQ